MRKITLAILLVSSLIFGYVVTNSMAHDMTLKSGETFKFPGATVKNPQGEDLGIIAEVVEGPEGRAAFAVLTYWVSDDTQQRVAVPLDALSCKEQSCVLNASKDSLDSAPIFVSEGDLAEPKTAEDIYRYFGVQPYWTEGGTGK
jgi:hypothetical protein